jgi:hypothetical protein
LGSKSNFDVTWQDLKDKSSITVQTEFLVCDRSIKTENDDDFLYKLIFYLSTGKIMIQGKGYELFRDNIFKQCLSLVSEYLTTSVKTDEVKPDIVTTVQVTDLSSQDTDETMLKCCTVTDQCKLRVHL